MCKGLSRSNIWWLSRLRVYKFPSPAGLFITACHFILGHVSQYWEAQLSLKFSESYTIFFLYYKKLILRCFALHSSSFAVRHCHPCQTQAPKPVSRSRCAGDRTVSWALTQPQGNGSYEVCVGWSGDYIPHLAQISQFLSGALSPAETMQTCYSASGEIYAGTAESLDLTNWNENSNVIASRLVHLGSLGLGSGHFNVESLCVRALKAGSLLPTFYESCKLPSAKSKAALSSRSLRKCHRRDRLTSRLNFLVVSLMAENTRVGTLLITTGLGLRGWKTCKIIH